MLSRKPLEGKDISRIGAKEELETPCSILAKRCLKLPKGPVPTAHASCGTTEQAVRTPATQHGGQQARKTSKGPDDIEEAEVEIIDDNKP